ncbi:tRNA pseudouridine synthase A [Cooperia oncophora]
MLHLHSVYPLFQAHKRKRVFDFDAHPRRKIALQFLYHGWEFDGLVQQTNTDNTVEKHLMDALLKTKLICSEKDCDFSRCGRTDKGVSAFKQVAAVVELCSDVRKKIDCCLQVDMNEKRVTMSFVRELFEISIEPVSSSPNSISRNDLLELTVKGSGFLWHMIRYIVTVLHEIGQGNEQPELVSELLDVEKTPCRPQYALAVATPLCLFECRFDSANLEWIYDDYALKRTVANLQSYWADFQTRARMIENMVNNLAETPLGNNVDLDKGLLEFTQDRPLPARYVKFADRKTCDSLRTKTVARTNAMVQRRSMFTMSSRKLRILGFKKTFVDIEDDAEYKNFFEEVDASHFKLKSSEWWEALKAEADEEKWTADLFQVLFISTVFPLRGDMPKLNAVQHISSSRTSVLGRTPSKPRGVIVNAVLDVLIAKKYEQNEQAQQMTGARFHEKEEERIMQSQNKQNPLNLIDYSSEEFAAKTKSLCQLLGIVEHPNPAVCLKAACIFINENLNESVIKERNAEQKSSKKPSTFELKSFPLDVPDQKDGAVNAIARILRLLNIEALRKTQTSQMSAETRRRPNILITGTPGTGKSTLAQEVASRLQFDAIDVGKEVREHGLVEAFDPRLNCHVLDEEKLLDHMEDRMNSDAGGVVVDYHGVDFFPERWFDIVVVLRCSNTILYDRLAQRGYDQNKVSCFLSYLF